MARYTADDPAFFYPGLNLDKLATCLSRSRCTSVCLLVAVLNRLILVTLFSPITPVSCRFREQRSVDSLAERNGTTFEEARDSTGPAVEAVLDPSQAYIKGSSMFLGATFNVAYAFADWGSVWLAFATQGKGTYDAFGFYNIENTVTGDFAETQQPLPDEISINVKTEEVVKG